jgi:hypothetical protein
MGEHVYQLAVYTLWCCPVGAAVCWWSDTWTLLFDSARCCGVWLAGSRQGLRVLWVSRAVVLMACPASTVHCHATGIVIGESWLGDQGMQKVQNVFLSPLSPYSHATLSSVPVLTINMKQKWRHDTTDVTLTCKTKKYQILTWWIEVTYMKFHSPVVLNYTP